MQVICIGLFLFFMLNAVPGIIKNTLIALWSTRFISEDVDGVLRVHHWRSCSFWAGLWQGLSRRTPWPYVPFALETINSEMLEFFRRLGSAAGSADRPSFFLPLSQRLCP